MAWAGGGSGPDLFITMGRVGGFGGSHTVWGVRVQLCRRPHRAVRGTVFAQIRSSASCFYYCMHACMRTQVWGEIDGDSLELARTLVKRPPQQACQIISRTTRASQAPAISGQRHAPTPSHSLHFTSLHSLRFGTSRQGLKAGSMRMLADPIRFNLTVAE